MSDHQKYYDALLREESMLIILRDELYAKSWDRMIRDLEDRLKGKPYIFALVNRIEGDIERIKKLKAYEEEHKINLADFQKKR